MFGRGRTQNGIIVEPSAGNRVDLDDLAKVSEYLDLIWCVFIGNNRVK